MKAVGIDLGGTKIMAQVFDTAWSVVDSRRVPTPQTYPELVVALRDLVGWADALAGQSLPVGIGAAGLIRPDGTVLTGNLCATGHDLPGDITAAIGRPVAYLNDARAFTLSEAVFGAGRGARTVMALLLGTGVGGGIAVDGQLLAGPTGTGSEFGQIAAPASVVAAHGLPVVRCGCGRMGCIETLLSGAGLSRIGEVTMGAKVAPPDIIAARADDPAARKAWDIWCDLAAELVVTLTLTVDPDCIVLGGGMSLIPGVVEDVQKAAAARQLAGFDVPPLRLAEGGPESGARGAAYAAVMADG